MDICKLSWADSDLEKITVEYDTAVLKVYNDSIEKRLCIICGRFIGMTDVCLWDDTIISQISLVKKEEPDTDFLRQVFQAYDKNFGYGENRFLNKGLLDLQVRLINGISFHIYCQDIKVEEALQPEV